MRVSRLSPVIGWLGISLATLPFYSNHHQIWDGICACSFPFTSCFITTNLWVDQRAYIFQSPSLLRWPMLKCVKNTKALTTIKTKVLPFLNVIIVNKMSNYGVLEHILSTIINRPNTHLSSVCKTPNTFKNVFGDGRADVAPNQHIEYSCPNVHVQSRSHAHLI